MKRRDIKAIASGAFAQAASLVIMWNWTDLRDMEMGFLSFFALYAGASRSLADGQKIHSCKSDGYERTQTTDLYLYQRRQMPGGNL